MKYIATILLIALLASPVLAHVYVGEWQPNPSGTNVVFYPSAFTYNYTSGEKIPDAPDEAQFVEMVKRVIKDTFYSLDTYTATQLPKTHKFNFYYSYEMSDAFEGVCGTLPAGTDAEDISIILYSGYKGWIKSTNPAGCTAGTMAKMPADNLAIQLHEIGHVAFGLVDTYDGPTYYFQSVKYPNVWESEGACRSYASDWGRDPDQCRAINPSWWKWDASPDIMAYHYKGRFGEAATERIKFVLGDD